MKRIIIPLLASMLFFSCGGDTNSAEESEIHDSLDDGADIEDNFVMIYMEDITEITYSDPGTNPLYIYMRFSGTDVLHSLDHDSRFWELATLYNDTSYNTLTVPYMYSAFADVLDYINITCNEDYNDNYRAGDSLNDITVAKTYQYYDYIQSGYTTNNCRVVETFTKINETDYLMVDFDKFYISFTEMPNVSGHYTFNIEIKVGESVCSCLLGVDWEI